MRREILSRRVVRSSNISRIAYRLASLSEMGGMLYFVLDLMVSKEEVKISIKTGLPILMTYYEECYNCRVHSLGTKLRIKIPEGVCLCEECRIEQISQKGYKEKKGTTRTAYEIGYGFLEKIYADDDIKD